MDYITEFSCCGCFAGSQEFKEKYNNERLITLLSVCCKEFLSVLATSINARFVPDFDEAASDLPRTVAELALTYRIKPLVIVDLMSGVLKPRGRFDEKIARTLLSSTAIRKELTDMSVASRNECSYPELVAEESVLLRSLECTVVEISSFKNQTAGDILARGVGGVNPVSMYIICYFLSRLNRCVEFYPDVYIKCRLSPKLDKVVCSVLRKAGYFAPRIEMRIREAGNHAGPEF